MAKNAVICCSEFSGLSGAFCGGGRGSAVALFFSCRRPAMSKHVTLVSRRGLQTSLACRKTSYIGFLLRLTCNSFASFHQLLGIFLRVNEIRAPARPCIPKLLRNKSFDATNQRFVLTFHYIMLADSSQSGKFFFPFRAWSERGHFMRMCISIYVITYYPRIRKCQLLCACLRVGCSPVSNILVFI